MIGRRDDGALLVRVEASPCVLTVADDPDDGVGIWANSIDAVAARGNWLPASGPLPRHLQKAVADFVAQPDWCQIDV